MGMFSEIAASGEALALGKVIEASFESKDSSILMFVEKHILPLYELAAHESWDDTFISKIELYKNEFLKLSGISSTKRGPVE